MNRPAVQHEYGPVPLWDAVQELLNTPGALGGDLAQRLKDWQAGQLNGYEQGFSAGIQAAMVAGLRMAGPQ